MTRITVKCLSNHPPWWTVLEIWDESEPQHNNVESPEPSNQNGNDNVVTDTSKDIDIVPYDQKCTSHRLLTILIDCGWSDKLEAAEIQRFVDQLSDSVDVILLTQSTIAHVGGLAYFVRYATNPGHLAIYCTEPIYKLGRATLFEVLESVCTDNTSFELFDADDVQYAFDNSCRLKYYESRPLRLRRSVAPSSSCNEDAAMTHAGVDENTTNISAESSTEIPTDFVVVQALPAGSSLGSSCWRICIGGHDVIYATEYSVSGTAIVDGTCLTHLVKPPQLFITDGRNPDKISNLDCLAAPRALINAAVQCLTSTNSGCVLIPVDAAGLLFDILLILGSWWLTTSKRFPVALLSSVGHDYLLLAKTSLEYMKRDIRSKFSSTRENPFHNLHWLNVCSTVEEFQQLPRGPKLVIATPASLDVGLSRAVLGDFITSPHNLILFPDYPKEGTLAHLLWRESSLNHDVAPLATNINGDETMSGPSDTTRPLSRMLQLRCCWREFLSPDELRQIYMDRIIADRDDIISSGISSVQSSRVTSPSGVDRPCGVGTLTSSANTQKPSNLFGILSFDNAPNNTSSEICDEYGEDYSFFAGETSHTAPNAMSANTGSVSKRQGLQISEMMHKATNRISSTASSEASAASITASASEARFPSMGVVRTCNENSFDLKTAMIDGEELGFDGDVLLPPDWMQQLIDKCGANVLYRIKNVNIETAAKCSTKLVKGLSPLADFFALRTVIAQLNTLNVMLLPTCSPHTLSLLTSYLGSINHPPAVQTLSVNTTDLCSTANSSTSKDDAFMNEDVHSEEIALQDFSKSTCTGILDFNTTCIGVRLEPTIWKALLQELEQTRENQLFKHKSNKGPLLTRIIGKVTPLPTTNLGQTFKRRRSSFWGTTVKPAFQLNVPISGTDVNSSAEASTINRRSPHAALHDGKSHQSLKLCKPSTLLVGSPSMRDMYERLREIVPEHMLAFNPETSSLSLLNKVQVGRVDGCHRSRNKSAWLVQGTLSPSYFLARTAALRNFEGI